MSSGFYSFLPFVRQGFSTQINNVDGDTAPAGLRPKINLTLSVEKTPVSGTTPPENLVKSVSLRSPVDVIGISKNAIVKVSPANWVTNFEPNYLPYIEFYDEDFPWRYTPAKAKIDSGKIKLRPWLALVVLKEDEFTNDPFNNILPSITLTKNPSTIFPAQQDLWAWAHVHVNDNVAQGEGAIGSSGGTVADAVTKLKQILERTPDKGISRIVCPRRLEANTAYHAFLIPVFEAGRLAGLGKEIPSGLSMTEGAWGAAAEWQFPVYHNWFFKTGGAGDFESLVRLLQPRILDNTVGKRAVDLQKSNHPVLEQTPLPDPGDPTIDMQGVIQPVDTLAEDWDFQSDYSEAIREIINRPTEILTNSTALNVDPVIAPPIYGRWHAAQDTVNPVTASPDWLQEANLDPRMRAMAGAGAEVVRRNQEAYMEAAWKQVGEVIEANTKLRLMQLSRQSSRTLYDKHLVKLNNELLVNIAAPIHERILNFQTSAKTVYHDIKQSALPVNLFTGSFRRMTRDNGVIARGIYIGTGNLVTTTELLSDFNNGTAVLASPYSAPLGMITYGGPANTLTPSYTLSLPSNAGFIPAATGILTGTPAFGPISSTTATFLQSVASLHAVVQNFPVYTFNPNPALSVTAARNIILTRTEPYNNALDIAQKTVMVSSILNAPVTIDNLNPVMAHPRIKQPMYKELAALSPDWMMPGLNDIQMNSINMLEHNQKYIEAFMLGGNYEMNRELLWRGYPTDQRATVFSYFWGYNSSMASVIQVNVAGTPATIGSGIYDLDARRDIEDIHLWKTPSGALKQLGTNSVRPSAGNMTILAVRGELLRKFPGTVIYLQKSKWKRDAGNNPIFTEAREEDTTVLPLYPAFTGKIEPDIYLLGFELEAEVIKGGFEDALNPGYFVVFQERVGELRFGADEFDGDPDTIAPPPPLSIWDDVTWMHLKNAPGRDGFIDLGRGFDAVTDPDSITWNANSAAVAYALLQSPVKLNVHAYGLLP